MADMKLSTKTFKTLVIILIAAAAVLLAGIIAIYAAPGLLGGLNSVLHPDAAQNQSAAEETGPWGLKSFAWEYQNQSFTADVEITKEVYQSQNKALGTDLTGYILSDATAPIASQIAAQASALNFDDRQTADLAIAFARSIAYGTDDETGHPSTYPRTPAVTLADGTGDSEDLTILASALLENLGFASAILSYPAIEQNSIHVPHAAALGVPGTQTDEGPLYNLSNRTLETIWIADTAEKGWPAYAYYIENPQILPAPSFASGKIPAASNKETLPTANLLDIPEHSIPTDSSWLTWRGKAAAFYESGWRSSGISWTTDDIWKLYEHYLTISTDQKTGEFTAGSLWRLSYTVNILPDTTVNGMTPYSNANIVLYRIVNETPVLLETFGWQGTSGADPRGHSLVYPPGDYAVGVFVRNVDVTVDVEFGEQPAGMIAGGI